MKNSIINHKNYDKLLKEFHLTKNGDLKLSDFSHGSRKKIWWICNEANDHEWETSINERTKGKGCPCCSGHKVVLSNCLALLNKNLANQWHPTKNGTLTPFNVTQGSGKKVWWKCDKGNDHEWQASIGIRNYGNGCPCCEGLKVTLSNCLMTTCPDISKQWHPTKNGTLTPYNITNKSGKKVWWKCDKANDHEWQAIVASRTNGSNCPCCNSKKIVLSNCLATTHEILANQWHPTKNGNLTPFNVFSGSDKKVWWLCDKSKIHEWNSSITSRNRGNGCPYCNESKGEKKIKSILEKMHIKYNTQKRYDECKNKNTLPFDIYLIDYDALIEYDGILYYKPDEYMSGQEAFEAIKNRDEIKTKYAQDNNIPLLRIPYTEFDNIENIIINFIKELDKFK